MNLSKTRELMKKKSANKDFDSYAVFVSCGGQEALLTSDNVNVDTYFDAASMTKVLVTSTIMLGDIGNGLISLDDTIDMYFDNVPDDKKGITVEQLLTHTSGIIRVNIPNRVTDHSKDATADYIMSVPLAFKPGTDYQYSCNGYILLGFILEKVHKMPLDRIFESTLKKSLGLTRSKFNISKDEDNAAICYRWREVGSYVADDENAYNLHGVAGNAASFWTLRDMKKFMYAVSDRSDALYKREMFDIAEQNLTPALSEGRGLGYLVVNEHYKQVGKLFPVGSFGHCGHCGQSFFINRDKDLFVIILTNATRFANMKNEFKGYDYEDIKKMREDIHNAIFDDIKDQL